MRVQRPGQYGRRRRCRPRRWWRHDRHRRLRAESGLVSRLRARHRRVLRRRLSRRGLPSSGWGNRWHVRLWRRRRHGRRQRARRQLQFGRPRRLRWSIGGARRGGRSGRPLWLRSGVHAGPAVLQRELRGSLQRSVQLWRLRDGVRGRDASLLDDLHRDAMFTRRIGLRGRRHLLWKPMLRGGRHLLHAGRANHDRLRLSSPDGQRADVPRRLCAPVQERSQRETADRTRRRSGCSGEVA